MPEAAGRLAVGWPPRLSTPGSLGLQVAAELQEQDKSKPEAPVLFSLPLALPVVQSKSYSQPRCKREVGKGPPSLYGRSRQLCALYNLLGWPKSSSGFFCKLLRNYLTNPIPYHSQDAYTVCCHFLNSLEHSIFSTSTSFVTSHILEVVNK